MVKKYLVVKERHYVTPDVERDFDNWEDANQFALLCTKSDKGGYKYWVYELSEK